MSEIEVRTDIEKLNEIVSTIVPRKFRSYNPRDNCRLWGQEHEYVNVKNKYLKCVHCGSSRTIKQK